jgi:hypothetical protein
MTVMAIMIVALGNAVPWDQEDPIVAPVVHAVIVASDLARPIGAGSNSKAYVKERPCTSIRNPIP